MSVRCRPDVRRLSKRLRLPQALHLFFKFGLVDMICEGHRSVDEHYGDVLTVLLLKLRIALDVDDPNNKRHTLTDALDDLFRVITKMTSRPGVNFHLNTPQQAEKL